MKKSNQLKFFEVPREHGGKFAYKKRKCVGPLTAKYPIHIVLRSDRAKGSLSFLNYQNKIINLIHK